MADRRSFLKGVCVVLIFAPVSGYLSFQTLVLLSGFAISFLCFLKWRSNRKWRFSFGGTVSPGFEAVAEVFRENLKSKQEQGAAFAAYYEGELVVDLWGGYADYDALRYRAKNSTSMFYSVTKVVTAVCMALLTDRGLLDYKAPVASYWSEFGQKGKEKISVETLLSHRSGLIAIREKHKLALLRDDPALLGQLLAQQEPFWTPGTAQGYQTLTYGLYADQLVRRVDPRGRSLGKFFNDEIGTPFDIDVFIGEPRSEHHRACRESRAYFGFRYLLTTTIPTACEFAVNALWSLVKYRAIYLMLYIGNPTDWRPRKLNDPDYRELESGASHGFGTARGLAKLMGILANGGQWKGTTLLTPRTIERLNTPLSDEFDRVVLRNICYGPGTTIVNKMDDKQQVRAVVTFRKCRL